MSVTGQGSAVCVDAGTQKAPSITHTASSQYETATILTTLLDVASSSHSNYSLSKENLELALGGNAAVGSIGDGDPVADLRSSVGGDVQAKAQTQLAWNAQFISIITTASRLIEAQANSSLFVTSSPTDGQPHTQAALSALKSVIKAVNAANGRRLANDRRLASALNLGDVDAATSIINGAFAELSSSLIAASSVLTVVAPPTDVLNAVVTQVAQVNQAIADAAAGGLLTIGQMNVYNHMQQSVADQTEKLATGEISVASFKNRTNTLKLADDARSAIEAIAFDRFGPPTTAPTSIPSQAPTAGEKSESISTAWMSSSSFWLTFALILIAAVVIFLIHGHFERKRSIAHAAKRKSKISFENSHSEVGLDSSSPQKVAKVGDLEHILVRLDEEAKEEEDFDIVPDAQERYPPRQINVLQNGILADTIASLGGMVYSNVRKRTDAEPLSPDGVTETLAGIGKNVRTAHPGIVTSPGNPTLASNKYQTEADSPPTRRGDLHRILVQLDAEPLIGFYGEGEAPTEEEEREVRTHRTVEASEDVLGHGQQRQFSIKLARVPILGLGLQFKHNGSYDKICVSALKPGGPAAVSGQICVGDHLMQLDDWVLPANTRLDKVLLYLKAAHDQVDFKFSTASGSGQSPPLVLAV
jgi:hypothetical protein